MLVDGGSWRRCILLVALELLVIMVMLFWHSLEDTSRASARLLYVCDTWICMKCYFLDSYRWLDMQRLLKSGCSQIIGLVLDCGFFYWLNVDPVS